MRQHIADLSAFYKQFIRTNNYLGHVPAAAAIGAFAIGITAIRIFQESISREERKNHELNIFVETDIQNIAMLRFDHFDAVNQQA